MRKRQNGESLFLRFRLGAPMRVTNDITDKIKEFIQKNNSSDNYTNYINELIKPINDGYGYGISVDSTWFQLIKELIKIFEIDSANQNFDRNLLNRLFIILVKETNINDLWNETKHFILDHIEQFSLWEFSYYKLFNETRKIRRNKRGKYLEKNEGKIYEVSGVKTFEEEKFDFIMSTTLSEYGQIYQLLKFISLVYISLDFKNNPEDYPRTVNIFLPESKSHCWFILWKWNVDRLYGYMKSGWRPEKNYCDPDWLVSDLLAEYSDRILEDKDLKVFEKPEDSRVIEYEKAFVDYKFQFAYALDTELRIGNQIEIYISFKGRKIRWINGTAYTRTVVVIPTKDLKNISEEETLLNEFISALVWETEIPIRKMFCAGAAKSFFPIISGSRNLGGTIHDVEKLEYDNVGISEREMLALALYKEGVNSTSVYYATLNYYKIIELLFKGEKNDIIEWINNNREFLIQKGYEAKLVEIELTGKSIFDYVYVSCRCAVTHAGQIKSTISPDDITDYKRISKDVDLIKELARNAIDQGLFTK